MNIPLINPDNVLSSYVFFRNALLSSATKSIPLKNSARCKIPSPPWWDSECTQACQSRSEAEDAYAAAMTSENFISYQRIAAKTVRLLSEKKRSGWLRFCEELSPISPPSHVWKNLRRFRCSYSSRSNDTNDPSDWIDHFSCRLAPPSVPSLEETSPSALSSNSTDDFDSPFSWEELSAVLESLSDSSPGIDGIPSGTNSSSPTPERTVSLPNLDKSIPILKPEIVIEERRWYPYPMIIRHYIEKPKSSEKFTALKKWYKSNQEKRRKKAERKKDMQKILAEKERIERERCLKELRRLHSHHQSLCCRSRSLPTFGKFSKPEKSCKISYKTRATTAKDK
ncbi:hypothetical protein RR48_03773 [Papilio machaon]|uniref:Uncharacterized protein n=1 Tax=Papilio machaon TaxID=76193 RepID=A0A0N0PAW4_PAPMA|nr:hypothetical protein RR48_03773 [Papilio machaon]